jgi:hypothetical protein
MSLVASSLKHNKAQKLLIKKEVKGILSHIDDELRNCHETGRHNITLTLPINFSITYMDNKTAQRKIYYAILISLIDREFIPKLELQQEKTLIHIKWLSDEEICEIKLQHELLAKYTIRDMSKVDISTG